MYWVLLITIVGSGMTSNAEIKFGSKEACVQARDEVHGSRYYGENIAQASCHVRYQ